MRRWCFSKHSNAMKRRDITSAAPYLQSSLPDGLKLAFVRGRHSVRTSVFFSDRFAFPNFDERRNAQNPNGYLDADSAVCDFAMQRCTEPLCPKLASVSRCPGTGLLDRFAEPCAKSRACTIDGIMSECSAVRRNHQVDRRTTPPSHRMDDP